jgi:hypothetical protein
MNTNLLGSINVNDGIGQVTIDNQVPNIAVVVNDVSAGSNPLNPTSALSVIDIIDTRQPAATGQTLYVYRPALGQVAQYQGPADLSVLQMQDPAYLQSVTSGSSASYSPQAGLRWQWQLQANLSRTISQVIGTDGFNVTYWPATPWAFTSSRFDGEINNSDPWYFLGPDGQPTAPTSSGTDSTPYGQLVVQPGLPVFHETISGTAAFFQALYGYHIGHYGFVPSNPPQIDPSNSLELDPWEYFFATDATLTLTNSVKADNPIGIHFFGPAQSFVHINSVSPVILAGSITDPDGDTTITAPSITQQDASETITSNNLTLTSTVGGVGTLSQPVNGSLAANGVLKVTSVGSVYLNLDSGARLDNIQTYLGGGDVVIKATGSLDPAPGLVSILAKNITLTSATGEVGNAAAPETLFAEGVVNVAALGDVGLVQGSFAGFGGDLKVGEIVSTSGNVTITVPGGNILNSSGMSWAKVVGNTQSQQVWQNLSLTAPAAAQQQAVTAFENEVNSDYTAYWQLLDNGSVQNGVLMLNALGLALYRQQAGQAQTPPINNPTDAQVQTYANNLYQNYVTFFNQYLGSNWMNAADFQTYNPRFNYQATSQQVANLESNAGWTTPQLMNPVARVAVDPYAGTPVGLWQPNISGAMVTLVANGSIGRTSAPTAIALADLQSGNLTAAQIAALADATAPEDVTATSTGIEVSPTAQVFISARGNLNANAAGSITIQGTSQDLTLNQVTAGGPVNITAQRNILSSGTGTQITTPGNTVLKVGTGTVGSPTTPLNVNVGGQLHVYASPGNAFITGSHPTTLAIVASTGSTSTYGQSVTFTATISDSGAGVPTGSVKFYDGATLLGDGSPLSGSGNSATSTFTTSTLAAGVHSPISAVYIPNGNLAGSSGSLSLTVNRAPLTITANSTSKFYGQTETFANTAFTETGLVNGDTITGVAETSTGAAAPAPAGTYNIVPFAAAGSGLSDYTVTYVNGTLTVNPAATGTVVVSSLNPSIYGQSVTFTATVSNTTSGSSFVPTGSVQFVVDGSNFGSPVPLDATGKAATSLNMLAVRSSPHSIQVLYVNADGNFQNSNSTLAGGQNVNPATTSTVVVSSANPSVYGQPVTFTATVSNTTSGSSFVPTGSVQFIVDGSNFGAPVTVDATGHAVSLPDTFLSGASHIFQAVYTNSDGNFINSNSPNLAQTVQQIAVEPDPSNPALTDLFIGSNGATSNDQVQVNPVGSSNTGSTGVKVQTALNGVNTQITYSQSFSAIYVFLRGGNDNVQLASTMTINAVVSAGNGNDSVQLGNGNNTVTLGNGNDNIQAGDGSNTVNAGAVGSTGNILIGLGNGANNRVTLLGDGNDDVQLGNGSNGSVSITGNGNDHVEVGDGNNESVSITGDGNDQVAVGNGTGDWVSIVGNGNEDVQTGTGTGSVSIRDTGHRNFHLGNGWTHN